MSVTFDTDLSPITGYAFECGHSNGLTSHRFDTYEEAAGFLAAERGAHGLTGHLAVCGDGYCRDYGRMHISAIESDPAPDLSVSGSNAIRLLRLMGLPTDFGDGEIFGSAPASEFHARVMSSRAAVTAEGDTGYIQGRLSDLQALADFAVSRGKTVRWG